MTKAKASGKPSRTVAGQKAAKDPNSRSMGMKALGAILTPVTRPAMAKQSATTMQLILDWADIVGPELARFSSPRKLGGGTLLIACAGPAAVEMQFMTPQLIERVNVMIRNGGSSRSPATPRFHDADPVVQRIRLVHDPVLDKGVTVTSRRKSIPISIDAGASDALNAVLGRLGGLVHQREAKDDAT